LIIKNDEDFFNLKINSESGFAKPIPIVLSFEIAKNNCSIQTLEGIQNIKKDDFIMIGLEGEKYCITQEKFYTKYKILELNENNLNLARKNVSEIFEYAYIKFVGGNYALMNNQVFEISNDDYFVRYDKNDFGIIKKNLFSKLYQII
jgi:hypothetical protein